VAPLPTGCGTRMARGRDDADNGGLAVGRMQGGSPVRVVITGGAGFLGTMLKRALLTRGTLTGPSGGQEPIESIVLFDAVDPPAGANSHPSVVCVTGDIGDTDLVRSVVDRDDVSVFHLASMVSAGSELDFDRALRVNVGGSTSILEACRARGSTPRFVFSSSIVAFGGIDVDEVVSDETKQAPETTYGTTKAICELLVNDYTRKGFLDGRSARLPTVVIRPGQPNAAASSWVSGIFREPLNGIDCVVPVDADMHVPISGYRTIIENLIRLHEVDGARLGPDRALNLPALDPTPVEMSAALSRASDRTLGTISFEIDPLISAFFRGWAQHSSFARAEALNFVRDTDLESIIGAYIEDFLGGPGATPPEHQE
jgi:D-erythronate 2-dehydrogenase